MRPVSSVNAKRATSPVPDAPIRCPTCRQASFPHMISLWSSIMPGSTAPVLEAPPQRNAGPTDGYSQGGCVNTGWEVRPLGWILLALLAVVTLFYALTKLYRLSNEGQQTR